MFLTVSKSSYLFYSYHNMSHYVFCLSVCLSCMSFLLENNQNRCIHFPGGSSNASVFVVNDEKSGLELGLLLLLMFVLLGT